MSAHGVDTRVPFVGRARELERLAACFRNGGAMTLLGPGGVGKSRLALEAVERWQREGSGRKATFIPLAGVEPAAAAAAVARALGAREEPNVDLADAIAGAAQETARAVVLDNCEDAVAELRPILERLAGLPGTILLATSRARTGYAGETVLDVEPFDARDGSAFFAARARNADVEVDPAGADAGAVGRIVASLDGLAIAIDLAAARLASLSVRELADELIEPRPYHFRSSGGPQPRHWTLNRVVDWSVSKLDQRAQLAFALASAYAHDFTAADVAALAGDGTNYDAPLQALAGQSLILCARDGEYRMLAPIRAVAKRRRAGLPDRRAIDERFAAHLTAIARDVEERAKATISHEMMETLWARYDDLTNALAWALRAPARRLDATFAVFWVLTTVWADGGRFGEGLRWCEQTIEASAHLEEGRRGLAYYCLLRVAFVAGDYARMLEIGPQLIGTFTIVNDRLGLARAYNALGVASLATGRFDEAQTYVETALALYKSVGHERGQATALINLGNILLEARSDCAGARLRYLQALEPALRRGPDSIVALAYGNIAEAAYAARDYAGAESAAAEAIDRYRRMESATGAAWGQTTLARSRLSRGDEAGAVRELRAALEALQRRPHPGYVAGAVECCARLLAGRHEYARADLLARAAARLRRERLAPAFGPTLTEAEATRKRIERSLDPADAAAARAEAAALDLRQLPTLARSCIEQGTGGRAGNP
ncbi:MAG TPA: tetratricopeptide repeat protein [Verrucomicrobiae bacterium]|nr:tetratricopeptide repeat protein [Verrucomicrobiae bacterium]